jgi:LmbE family N-acetylglucosaminyl deacetylase
VPLTVWIATGVAIAGTIVLAAGLWFDWLFESPGAVSALSLVRHTGSRSVLAIFAHPDDETLAAGALADASSRNGIDVRTITLTKGEAGIPEPHVARRDDIRLIRESELRRYGFALGIDYQEVWEYPDGKLSEVPSRNIVDRIVERIRAWRPDLVLTFDPGSGYNGHPDHRAAGVIATEAVRAALDSGYRVELGTAHRPTAIGYVLAPARAFSAIGGAELRAVAAAQPHPNLAVPVDPDLRILGWRIHASQHLERAYPLPGWLLFDFWDKEHYRLVDPESGMAWTG